MRHRFVTPLTTAEQEALMDTYRYAEKPALRRRAHGILLSHKGHTIGQICEILVVTRNTVASWFKAWEAKGLQGLHDRARSGRPPIFDDQEHGRLQELVQEHPHQIKTVRARLLEETGKTSSTATLRRTLKKSAIASSASGAH
ncbi:Transposase [Vreelandella aquamarina]|jgi:transposase|uniref:Transposase n=1 Tax=Vreelandella aquamarina TaxID=77097 RepID=A0A1H8F2H7_9GAMM|nr:Transposase [Halomonas aquamarina]